LLKEVKQTIKVRMLYWYQLRPDSYLDSWRHLFNFHLINWSLNS